MKRFELTVVENRLRNTRETHRILTVYSPDTHRNSSWSNPLGAWDLCKLRTLGACKIGVSHYGNSAYIIFTQLSAPVGLGWYHRLAAGERAGSDFEAI